VCIDRDRLGEVVTNLLSNAVKFTAAGAVRLNVSVDQHSTAEPLLVISITDTGIGIQADKLEQIFERFVQADSSTTRLYGGTGLGLSISRRLARLMGGDLKVRSTFGSGSTFTMTSRLVLPSAGTDGTSTETARTTDREAAEGQAEELWLRRGSLPVLVVEDNIINQRVVTLMLTKLGVSVELACNGHEAVERYRPGVFAMMLMDCQMPVLDGYSATAQIREKESGVARIPIIAMTAHALRGDREQCLAAGMDDYTSKPISLDVLKAVLTRWWPRGDAGESHERVAVPPAPDTSDDTGDDDWDDFIRDLWLESADMNAHRLADILTAATLIQQGRPTGEHVTVARAAAHDFSGTLANLGYPEAGDCAREMSGYLRRAHELDQTEIDELARLASQLQDHLWEALATVRRDDEMDIS